MVPVTVASPITTPSRNTTTVSDPVNAVEIEPVTCGVISLVDPPSATTPSCGAKSSSTDKICTD